MEIFEQFSYVIDRDSLSALNYNTDFTSNVDNIENTIVGDTVPDMATFMADPIGTMYFKNRTEMYFKEAAPSGQLGQLTKLGISSSTLDGLDSTQFIRSDVDDIAYGNIIFDSGLKVGDGTASHPNGTPIITASIDTLGNISNDGNITTLGNNDTTGNITSGGIISNDNASIDTLGNIINNGNITTLGNNDTTGNITSGGIISNDNASIDTLGNIINNGNITTLGNNDTTGNITGNVLNSTTTSGAPFTVQSAALVTSLNADLLDGKHATAFANATHTHPMSDVIDLSGALAGKSDTGHTHPMSDVIDLSGTLAGKSDTGHTHPYAPSVHSHTAGSTEGQISYNDLTDLPSAQTTGFGSVSSIDLTSLPGVPDNTLFEFRNDHSTVQFRIPSFTLSAAEITLDAWSLEYKSITERLTLVSPVYTFDTSLYPKTLVKVIFKSYRDSFVSQSLLITILTTGVIEFRYAITSETHGGIHATWDRDMIIPESGGSFPIFRDWI